MRVCLDKNVIKLLAETMPKINERALLAVTEEDAESVLNEHSKNYAE